MYVKDFNMKGDQDQGGEIKAVFYKRTYDDIKDC